LPYEVRHLDSSGDVGIGKSVADQSRGTEKESGSEGSKRHKAFEDRGGQRESREQYGDNLISNEKGPTINTTPTKK